MVLLITHGCRLFCLELHIAEEVVWIISPFPSTANTQLLLTLLFHLFCRREVGELANLIFISSVLVPYRMQLMALLSTTDLLLIWCLLSLV